MSINKRDLILGVPGVSVIGWVKDEPKPHEHAVRGWAVHMHGDPQLTLARCIEMEQTKRWTKTYPRSHVRLHFGHFGWVGPCPT